MMEWTDRHCRFFLRLISKHALLYTEMVTADAVLRGDRNRLLQFHVDEHPVALQVGGSDATSLAEAARIGAEFGYDEINLNVGCPSDRVQAGRFGACLMGEPELVADLIAAISGAAAPPVMAPPAASTSPSSVTTRKRCPVFRPGPHGVQAFGDEGPPQQRHDRRPEPLLEAHQVQGYPQYARRPAETPAPPRAGTRAAGWCSGAGRWPGRRPSASGARWPAWPRRRWP